MTKAFIAALIAGILTAAVVAIACHGAGLDARGWLVLVLSAAVLVARCVYQDTCGKP